MPRHIGPMQIDVPRGMAASRLPFVIVTAGGSIQTAIDAVSPGQPFAGKHIWLWPGTWTLFASLTVPAGAEIYIWGCGRDTIVQMDPAGAGPDPMFQLAAGVVEFQLHDLTINRRGFAGTTISCLGACTHIYIDNIAMNLVDGPIGTNFLTEAAAGNVSFCDIEYSDLDGILDLRGTPVNPEYVRIHDSQLDALAGVHNFGDSIVVLSGNNRWLGGGVGVFGVVTIDGAAASFRDEGSHYTGNCALGVQGGNVNLRGCHLFADVLSTIIQSGGTMRLGTCEVVNNANQMCVSNNSGDYIGLRNCHFLVTPVGVSRGVYLTGCIGNVVGNKFENCGFGTQYSCTFFGNTIEAVVDSPAVYVRANRVAIVGNNILACAEATGIAIELLDNGHNVVRGNQLQGYTVNEAPGTVGNIITGNRVAA